MSILLFTILPLSIFVVHERSCAIVFTLGEISREIHEPGFYFKLPLPFQNVIKLDKRILTIESKNAERIQTSEKKNLLIDSFVKWKIVNPRLFYITFGGSEKSAHERLQAQIRDALNASVNVRTVKDVLSLERGKIMSEILTNVAKRAEPFGVEIVDVKLRRIEFAPEISQSVYKRMEAERTKVANELRSIGAAESEKIRAEADRKMEEIIAKANSKSKIIMGNADAIASAIYAESYKKNPDFYKFYRSLEAYKKSFNSNNDLFVINPKSEFFKYINKSKSN
ncbi:protease modulator HflC [Candidatus Kinetoplastibacterium sorsogonicusi]|nr:protease modulator HflC [Candidatus Kinetoplastibacterium sorsogonicusi]